MTARMRSVREAVMDDTRLFHISPVAQPTDGAAYEVCRRALAVNFTRHQLPEPPVYFYRHRNLSMRPPTMGHVHSDRINLVAAVM